MCMSKAEILGLIFSGVSALAAVAASVWSVIMHMDNIKRERQILTLTEWTKIRDKYNNIVQNKNDERISEYLNEMERFCTGVNLELYDIDILRKTSKKRLKSQYERLQYIIQDKRNKSQNELLFCEYEKVIKSL